MSQYPEWLTAAATGGTTIATILLSIMLFGGAIYALVDRKMMKQYRARGSGRIYARRYGASLDIEAIHQLEKRKIVGEDLDGLLRAQNEEARKLIKITLKHLSMEEVEVLRLRAQRHTYRDIAKELDIKPDMASIIARRAEGKVKEALQEETGLAATSGAS